MARGALGSLCALGALLAAAPAAAVSVARSRAAAGSGSVAATTSPVERVVELLQGLKARLQRDGEEEQRAYDKFACWCEATTQRKAGSIDEARGDLRAGGQAILTLRGEVATLAAEIQGLTADAAANEEAQKEATAIRQRENAAYQAEAAEMKQALAALEKALVVLRAATATGPSLLQRALATGEVRRALAAAVAAAPLRAVAALPSGQRALLQRLASGLGEAGAAGYAPQSATVQGLLGNMYETFSGSLEEATGAEATQNRDFEALVATKQQELLALQELLQKKTAAKAEAELLLAERTQDYDDTERQLQADVAFFDATKGSCQAKSTEWQTRSALRKEEIQGIAKALEILTSDGARELFATAVKPGIASFLQLGARGAGARGAAGAQAAEAAEAADAAARGAYEALRGPATRSHSLRLARLAAQVRSAGSGHFDQVITAIETMVATLKDEEAQDIAKRDQCKEEYQKVNSTSADLRWKLEVNAAALAKLEALLAQLASETAQTVQDIATVAAQIEELGARRREENGRFLQAKQDDESAIGLLSQAQASLSSYYSNHSISLLGQPVFEVSADQAPDTPFSDAGSRAGEARGVVAILASLVEDLQSQVADAVKDEAAAQLDFEREVATASALKASLEAKKANLEEATAQRNQDKVEEEQARKQNQGDLGTQVTYRQSIQADCDWIIGAFTERLQQRKAELEGLGQAKAFLAGYQPEAALVQGPAAFDDLALEHIGFARLAPARPLV